MNFRMKNQLIILLVGLVVLACKQDAKTGHSTDPGSNQQDLSPEQEIFYHVFQRSFYDSNNDTHGDLNGITAKLDYLKNLGITSILMTPLYKSIYYHNYFPDDFEGIDEEYGTMGDYNNMIKAIHDRNMKYYMDMEVQYVTKNHPWFKESFQNPDSEYSDYVIYNGPDNTNPETIIFNLTGLRSYNGDSLDIATIDLYNENVKTYIYDLFKYWVDPNKDGNFEDGVDGFRIDHMMDDLDWKGILTNLLADFWGPLVKELKAINPQLKIIAEQANWNDLGESYFEKSDVDFMFAFAVRNAITAFDKMQIVNKVDTTFLATPEGKHQLVFLENHDINRYASVVESNPAKLRFGAAFTILSQGTPLIYYGQELGMKGAGGFGIFGNTDANDIPRREAFEWYKNVEGPGMALWYKDSGPWWDQTYLKDNDGISYEEQVNDPNSLFNFYKNIIQVRQANPAFMSGKQAFIQNASNDVITFIRWDDNAAFLVAFNAAETEVSISLQNQNWPVEFPSGELQLTIGDGKSTSQLGSDSIDIEMVPYGYAVWALK